MGDEARRVERLEDEEVSKEIEDVLKTVYKDKIGKWNIEIKDGINAEDIFRPIDIHVCRWDTDPRFMGSYCFPKLGNFQNEISFGDFAGPVKSVDNAEPTLYFAGEAFSEKLNGYMLGALTTGE